MAQCLQQCIVLKSYSYYDDHSTMFTACQLHLNRSYYDDHSTMSTACQLHLNRVVTMTTTAQCLQQCAALKSYSYYDYYSIMFIVVYCTQMGHTHRSLKGHYVIGLDQL